MERRKSNHARTSGKRGRQRRNAHTANTETSSAELGKIGRVGRHTNEEQTEKEETPMEKEFGENQHDERATILDQTGPVKVKMGP